MFDFGALLFGAFIGGFGFVYILGVMWMVGGDAQ